MPTIIPAVLAKSKEEFAQKITDPQMRGLTDVFQIDILDGTMFEESAFTDATFAATLDLPPLELHLMIERPHRLARKWVKKTSRVMRSIMHAEIKHPLKAMRKLRKLGGEVGIALAPETSLEDARELIAQADMLLILGVHPGKSGQAFLGEPILQKIRAARAEYPNLPIAVDGGVSIKTAPSIIAAGATHLCAASALWNARDRAAAFAQLAK